MRPGEMVTTYQQRADGQWFACDHGVGRYDHVEYTYWRPVYPPAPKGSYARDWAKLGVSEPEAEDAPTSARWQVPAQRTDPDASWVPPKMRTALGRLRGAGLAVDLQVGIDHAGVQHVAARGVRATPKVVVVLFWHWRPPGPTTLKGEQVWRKGSWENDFAAIRADARARAAGIPTGKMSHTEALKAVA